MLEGSGQVEAAAVPGFFSVRRVLPPDSYTRRAEHGHGEYHGRDQQESEVVRTNRRRRIASGVECE